jgi:hypothetical protein
VCDRRPSAAAEAPDPLPVLLRQAADHAAGPEARAWLTAMLRHGESAASAARDRAARQVEGDGAEAG